MNLRLLAPLLVFGCSSMPSPCGTQPPTQLYEDACHDGDGPMYCFYETQSGF